MESLNRPTSLLQASAHSHSPPSTYTAFPARFSYPHQPPPLSSARRSVLQMSSQTAAPTVSTVTISYPELKDPSADISEKIDLGFGPNGIGILSISEVPGYTLLRQNLLQLAPRLASLPEEVKQEIEDPHSRYNIGWSHGKEKLESGKLDMLKGSFYANPIHDVPTDERSLVKRYPSYCGRNIWPRAALPELEHAFKALGKLILDVGLLLAYHCDSYASNGFKRHEDGSLQQILLRSRCHKGRLLYYFPTHQWYIFSLHDHYHQVVNIFQKSICHGM